MPGLDPHTGLAAALFAIAALASFLLGFWVRALGVVDAPDGERKTQSVPVPRLGGLAIAIASSLTVLVLVGVALWRGETSQPVSLDIVGVIAVAFLAGLFDDLMETPALIKLGLLSAAFIAAAVFGLTPEHFDTPFGQIEQPAFLIIGSALWLLIVTNAVNFIDGANGLAVGCLAIMLAALGWIGTTSGDYAPSLWWLALLGALFGFLVHNLRGRLYAGDAGSLGLGALFASLSLVSGLSVWTVATLALPVLIDVLMTLVWRARQGRPWLKAHLDHAYQRLIAAGWSHGEVAILYWGLTLVAAILAYIAAVAGGAAPFLVFTTLCLSGIILWGLHRRALRPTDQGPKR